MKELKGAAPVELRTAVIHEVEEWTGWLARYGETPSGGVTRLLYDDAWQAARAALGRRMKDMGLSVRVDRTGNTFASVKGTSGAAETVAVGSHIDTVKNGGRYDGAYGVIAGLIAVERLQRLYGPPVRSIEVAAFCEEEGSRFPMAYWGSGSVTGARNLEDIAELEDTAGIKFTEAMEAAGFGREEQDDPRSVDWKAYLELHIEQGPVLEAEGLSIGIADAIVGQKRYAFRLGGAANHAGTTPMGSRRDAFAGAAAMAVVLEELALSWGDPLVATVGRLEITPNTPNVVPGEVLFTVDIRHTDSEALEAFSMLVEDRFRRIAEYRGLALASTLWVDAAPVPLDAGLADLAEGLAAARGLPARRLPSGAGHDAQMLQSMCPSALIFVPSRGGISHSPEEYTDPGYLADGILLLMDMLYKLAYEVKTP